MLRLLYQLSVVRKQRLVINYQLLWIIERLMVYVLYDIKIISTKMVGYDGLLYSCYYLDYSRLTHPTGLFQLK